MCGTPKKIYQHLLQAFFGRKVNGNAAKILKEKLVPCTNVSCQKMKIIFIDEIDQLFSFKQEVLSNLFSWAKDPWSKFLLIGAANTLDHTRFLSNLLDDNNLDPLVVTFAPYTEHQLMSILHQRLKPQNQTPPIEGQIPFFDSDAIEFCARKVSSSSGDIRKCLNIISNCLDEIIVKENIGSTSKVSLPQIASIIRSAFGSNGRGRQKQSILLLNLPCHQKITLVLIALSIEHFPTVNTPEKVGYMVLQLRRVLSVPTVASYEYEDAITALCAVQLLVIKKKKGRGKTKVEVNICLEDIKRILKNETFIMNLILRGEARLKKYKK
eukprot:TRINITY_DN633_c0_g1_i3.p1 TRINITY_DN633_c0_g1~~TRINITY_DN633_c0_g1_i3.p1  ORF type:complete len:325 (-),score=39.99 TRINITY_DN633_c0_g1_i3:41-1015(-)